MMSNPSWETLKSSKFCESIQLSRWNRKFSTPNINNGNNHHKKTPKKRSHILTSVKLRFVFSLSQTFYVINSTAFKFPLQGRQRKRYLLCPSKIESVRFQGTAILLFTNSSMVLSNQLLGPCSSYRNQPCKYTALLETERSKSCSQERKVI